MINYYFYENQLRSYLLQFCSIFAGLRVKTGKGACDEEQFITVPIIIGHRDRVVTAIMGGNTQNRTFSLPTMSAHLQSITMAPERRRNPGMIDQRVTMPVGGSFPEDLTVVKRAFPVPYNTTVELSIWASNTDQLYQILEQVLVLFNPDIQIQKSDGPFDWTKLTRVELTDIANEENYPSGTDRRLVQWTLTFEMPIYLSIPMGIKDDIVRKIVIQLGQFGSVIVQEVDEDGNLTPFGTPLAQVVVDSTVSPTDPGYGTRPAEGADPFPPAPLP